MSSSTLKNKTSTRRTGLSDLPDEILVNILSLLPTKFAVTTSLLLSRRWHYLWTSITNLKIRQDMFKERSQYINFVDRVTVLRKGSSLESFSLQCLVLDDNASRVNAWITNALIQCNVENLALQLVIGIANYEFPSCLFGCQSLVKFDLTMYGHVLSVPSSSSCSRRVFSNLKSLRLCRVTFGDYESAQKMLSCPLLEELSIKRCNWDNVRSIRVSCHNLKVLDIEEDYRYVTNIPNANYKAKVCFVTDNLWSFRFSGSLHDEYQICASSSMQLSTAAIYVHSLFHNDIVAYVIRCFKLINGLSKTQSLTLSINHFFMALESTPEQLDKMPVFECLTQLNMKSPGQGIHINSTVLRKIFERCPHLERLDIAKLSNVVTDLFLSPAPMCFRTHLKRIYIGTFYDYGYHPEDKEDAISVLLNNCAVLEKMVINYLYVYNKYASNFKNIKELQNKLNRRPKVSKDCRIILKHADI